MSLSPRAFPILLACAACTPGCVPHQPPAAEGALSACAIPVGGWLAGEGDGDVNMNFTGLVLEAGDGEAPDGCWDTYQTAGPAPAPDERATAYWFRVIGDDARPWTMGVAIPGAVRPIAVDDPVDGFWSYSPGGFSATIAALTLWADDGSILAWVSHGASLEAYDVPAFDFTLTQGDVVYRSHDICGSWAGYDIEVVMMDGSTARLPYGGSLDVGDLTLHHGSFDRATDYSNNCSDWFVADLLVGAGRN
jgi:hypothetical protein